MPQPDSRSQQPNLAGLSWYAVPDTVKQSLALASEHWDEPDVGDRYMERALEQAGDHPDVLVSAYRYFFYTHNYARALQVTATVLDTVRQRQSLPDDWRELKAILQRRRDDPEIRLYINTYAASSLVRARLGDADAAKAIAARVSEIECQNEFGGKVVRDILEAPGDDEEE